MINYIEEDICMKCGSFYNSCQCHRDFCFKCGDFVEYCECGGGE